MDPVHITCYVGFKYSEIEIIQAIEKNKMQYSDFKEWFVDQQLVVVGAGLTGLVAARLYRELGAHVRLLERDHCALTNQNYDYLLDLGIEVQVGEHSVEHFADAQMVVLSPGIPKISLQKFLPKGLNIPVYSELEIASWFVSEPIVAVTGTNGKTTTTSLISHILSSGGYKVFTGGNIGIPFSEYILSDKPVDVVVLEVSSFQLQNTYSFHPRIGVFLNFSANHLDFHRDMQEYLEAKLKLFQCQIKDDLAILPIEFKEKWEKEWGLNSTPVYLQAQKRFTCSALLGLHNQYNIEAAFQVCRYFGVQEDEITKALRSFRPYEHRLQVVTEKYGILFVDDSKATTIDALRAALESFSQPILLLAGGRFKGGDPEKLKALIKDKVRVAGLFGESRDLFATAWQGSTEIFREPTLEEAIRKIFNLAVYGDVVLLSPATSSFDQFASYKERGLAFQKVVDEL